MMQRISSLAMVVAVACCGSMALGDSIWTETFDTGVGRFDQTRGLGESKFVWNAATQQIDGEFERRTSGRLDRRYTELGQTLTHNDAVGLSLVVTPTDVSPELHAAAYLGFWNSTTEEMIGIRVGRPGGIHIAAFGSGLAEPQVDFTFGQTYFIDVLYNGVDEVTMDVYLGRNASGSLVGSTALTRQPEQTFEVDALFMGNPGTGSTTFGSSPKIGERRTATTARPWTREV